MKDSILLEVASKVRISHSKGKSIWDVDNISKLHYNESTETCTGITNIT